MRRPGGMRPALLELRAEAAIDIEYRAGHERGLGAREEQHACGNFLGPSEALQRMLLALRLCELAAVFRVHVGVDRARLQHVDGDAAWPKIPGSTLRVADDRGLGGDVLGKAGKRSAVS